MAGKGDTLRRVDGARYRRNFDQIDWIPTIHITLTSTPITVDKHRLKIPPWMKREIRRMEKQTVERVHYVDLNAKLLK